MYILSKKAIRNLNKLHEHQFAGTFPQTQYTRTAVAYKIAQHCKTWNAAIEELVREESGNGIARAPISLPSFKA